MLNVDEKERDGVGSKPKGKGILILLCFCHASCNRVHGQVEERQLVLLKGEV